jgi:integrase
MDILDKVKNYLAREKRMADYSVENITRTVEIILNKYKKSGKYPVPSKELAYRIEDDLEQKGRAPNTIRIYLYAHDYLYEAMNDGKKLNGAKGAKKPKVKGHRIDKLTLEERDKLLAAAENRRLNDRGEEVTDVRNVAIIAMFVFAGLRRHEAVNLNLDAVDMQRRRILILNNTDSDVEFSGVKNGKEEEIVMPLQVKAALEEYLPLRMQINTKSRALFLSGHTAEGSRFSMDGIGDLVRKIGRRADIWRTDRDGKRYKLVISPHLLRHTAASTMIASGVKVTDVQKQLRHSTLDMTMRYVHIDNADVQNSLDACFV